MAYSAIAHVKAQSSDFVIVTSSAIDTSGADFLVAVVSYYVGAGGTNSFSDSKSNTWTALTVRSVGNLRSKVYYAKNAIVGSGHTFTSNSSGANTFPGITVSAWSGSDTSAPFDQENATTYSSGEGSGSTGSITPGANNELVIATVAAQDSIGATCTIDGGFTMTDYADRISTGLGSGMAYLIQTSAAAANPTFDWSGTVSGTGAIASIASFKAAAGGGAATPWAHRFARIIGPGAMAA